MAERCAQHGLAAGPDGRCVLCRREGAAAASTRATGTAAPARARSAAPAPRGSVARIAVWLVLAALVAFGLLAWRERKEDLVAALTGWGESDDGAAEAERFTARHPLDTPAELQRRGGFAPEPAFALEAESYELVVPEGAAGSEPYGLLVWIDAGPSGALQRPDWRPVLARHRLLWAGPNQAGNGREVSHRVGLALAAVQSVAARLPLAPGRVFVGGFSGGAKSAQRALFMYPDVFAGGLFFAGADYFRDIAATSYGEGKRWPARFGPPPLFDTLRQRPFAMITGPADPNHGQMADVLAAMSEDGFARASLIVLPGLGHELPDGNALDRALRAAGAGL